MHEQVVLISKVVAEFLFNGVERFPHRDFFELAGGGLCVRVGKNEKPSVGRDL